MKKALIAIVILAILGVGIFALTKSSDNKTSTPTNQTSTPSTTSNTGSTAPKNTATESSTITYSSSGFSPTSLTVKSGTKVTIKNDSSDDIQLDSDPHPVHTDDPELNVGSVAAGQSATFTVTTKGTHGYHNHLDPNQTGTIVVQ